MFFRILGPLSVLDGEREVVLGGVKQRSLLALLLVHRNEALPLDRLTDLLWGERPPDTAAKTIQVYVSRLRRALGDNRIETRGHGYALLVDEHELDLERFEALCERARSEPPADAVATLEEALSLYRGDPLQDLVYEPWSSGEVERLEQLRLAAQEQLIDSELALGRHVQLVPELESRVRAHPLREQLRGQLMLALYRSGRQADALDTYREARALLDETLGLEPGPELRQLEQRILQHDGSLAAPRLLPPEGKRTRRGGTLVLAGAALLLAAAIAAVIVVLRRSDGHPLVVRPNSVVAVDPANGRVTAAIPVGKTPTEITTDGTAVWVLNSGEGVGTITRLDAASKQVTGTFSVSGTPRTIAVLNDVLWVGTSEGKVVAVDAGTGVTNATLTLRNAGKTTPFAMDDGPGWISAGGGAVWASSLRTVTRIDPRTLALHPVTSTAWGRLAYGLGSVWVLGDFVLTRLDRASLRRVATVEVGARGLGFAAGADAVWLPDDNGNAVIRVDPRRKAVVRTIDTGGGRPLSVTVGGGAVWVAMDNGNLLRIEPATNAQRSIHVGGQLRGVAFGAGLVWLTVD